MKYKKINHTRITTKGQTKTNELKINVKFIKSITIKKHLQSTSIYKLVNGYTQVLLFCVFMVQHSLTTLYTALTSPTNCKKFCGLACGHEKFQAVSLT